MPPSIPVITAIVAIPHSIACVTTCARFAAQHLSRRIWWDDFWAGFAQICAIVLWAISMELPMGGVYSRPLQFLGNTGMLLFYTAALWACKISVAVTIVKLLGPGRFKTLAKGVTYFFGLMWLGLSVQRLFACVNAIVVPICRVPVYTGYLELGTDLTSDSWLIGAPLLMLWKIKLSTYHRYLIGGAFLSGIATTIASIIHIYFIIVKDEVWTGLSSHIQVGISLVICNVLALSTFVYRRLHRMGNDSERTETPDLTPQDNFSESHHPNLPPTSNLMETETGDIKLTEFEFENSFHKQFNEECTGNLGSFGAESTQNIRSLGSGIAIESGPYMSRSRHISFSALRSESCEHPNRTPRSSISITK